MENRETNIGTADHAAFVAAPDTVVAAVELAALVGFAVGLLF